MARGESDWELEIWAPPRTLALSRLDELRPGIDRARALARAAGFEPRRRISGGHAVALGEGSLCVGFAEPAPAFEGTQQRYERLTAALVSAFAELGVESEPGELDDEWCPGAWSIRSGGVKLAGLAQRAVKGAAWAEAVVNLAPDPEAKLLLIEVYRELGLALDPATIGSLSDVAGREITFEALATSLRAKLEGTVPYR